MKKVIAVVFTAMALLVSACATTPSRLERISDPSYTDKLQEGVTTMAEVREMFGEPFTKMDSSDFTIWTYSMSQPQRGLTGGQNFGLALLGVHPKEHTSLMITFRNGVVWRKTITSRTDVVQR